MKVTVMAIIINLLGTISKGLVKDLGNLTLLIAQTGWGVEYTECTFSEG